jgi:hypothetical protein
MDDTVSVIHGDGTGSFNRPRVSALVPSLPRMLAAGDFNGDGRTDLAVGVHHTQMVSILLNDGAGGFGAPVHYAVGSYLASLAVADFNGDDSPDVAIGHGIAENSRVSILLGDGTGALVAAAGFPISSTPYDLAVGDFNHDGKQDLAAANAYFSIVELLLSRSNRPPVANAGPDQRVDYNPAGMTRVTLDGGASADPDGGSLTYRWSGPFPEGGGIVTGRDPVVTLPIGVSPITLVVNDGAVDSGADPMTVHVTVRPTGLVDPLAALVPEGQIAPLPKKAFAVGKTVPLKLWLFSGWTALTSQQVAPPRIVSALRDGTPIPLPGLNLTAGQAFQYQERDRSWLLDVPTRGWTPGTYTVVIEMPDSRRFAARFVVR